MSFFIRTKSSNKSQSLFSSITLDRLSASPDCAEFDRVYTECMNLPIIELPYNQYPCAQKEQIPFTYDLKTLFAELKDFVTNDAADNEENRADGVLFEYILELVDEIQLCLLCRLYSASLEKNGSIFYGPQIMRIAEDKYLFWP